MRAFTYLVVFFLVSIGYSQEASSIADVEIANFENGKITFVKDSVFIKAYLEKNLSNESKAIHINKIEIITQFSLGDVKEPYSMILALDKSGRTKIAKYLNFDGKIFSWPSRPTDNVEKLVFICEGIPLCAPNIYFQDGKRYWICGDRVDCFSPDADCKISKALIKAKL